MTGVPELSRILTLVFTDLVDSTALKRQRGDQAVGELIARHRALVGRLAEQCSGRIIDWAGDGCFLTFETPSAAVSFALRLQQKQRDEPDLPDVRTGLHMGEVSERPGPDGDLKHPRVEGLAVDLAARISGLARPEQVLMSAAVADSARPRLAADAFNQPILWRAYGPYSLKGFDEPLEIREAGLEGVAPLQAPTASEKAKPAPRRGSAATKRTTLRLGGMAAVVAALVAGAVYFAPPPAEDPIVDLPTGPKIAVLAFTNMSGDPEQEYFSDGLSEDIITKLSRFKDLFVIARNSTFRYKGKAVDVRAVASELGARYVLEGSVRKAGTSLRVTAQLLDASDGTHLWAETWDRDLSAASIFDVQDEITEQVVGTIADDGVISRARFADVEGRAPESLAAYECVLLAQAPGRHAHLRPDRERVRGCLERAVRDDPSYADAWTELAFLDLAEHMFPKTGSPDALARALRAAQRAVEADPTHERALLVLGAVHFFRHEIDRAYAEFERAIALNPNNAWVLTWVAGGYIFAGEGERGMTLVRRASALDPQHPTWLHHRVAAYRFQREEYAEALAAARNAFQGEFWTHLYVAASYGQLGRADEAGPAVAELLSLYPGFTLQTAVEELRKWNFPDEVIGRYVQGLRKAGVSEEPSE